MLQAIVTGLHTFASEMNDPALSDVLQIFIARPKECDSIVVGRSARLWSKVCDEIASSFLVTDLNSFSPDGSVPRSDEHDNEASCSVGLLHGGHLRAVATVKGHDANLASDGRVGVPFGQLRQVGLNCSIIAALCCVGGNFDAEPFSNGRTEVWVDLCEACHHTVLYAAVCTMTELEGSG